MPWCVCVRVSSFLNESQNNGDKDDDCDGSCYGGYGVDLHFTSRLRILNSLILLEKKSEQNGRRGRKRMEFPFSFCLWLALKWIALVRAFKSREKEKETERERAHCWHFFVVLVDGGMRRAICLSIEFDQDVKCMEYNDTQRN